MDDRVDREAMKDAWDAVVSMMVHEKDVDKRSQLSVVAHALHVARRHRWGRSFMGDSQWLV